MDNLRERAVDRCHHLVAQLVRHLEDESGVLHVVVLGVGAGEVRGVIGDGDDAVLRRAGGELAPQALVAASAGREVRVDDAIAFLQGPAHRVRADVRAELRHASGHLVAEDARAGAHHGDADVAAPDMKVGATDAGRCDLDDETVRRGVRHGVLAYLESLSNVGVNGCLACLCCHGGGSPSVLDLASASIRRLTADCLWRRG